MFAHSLNVCCVCTFIESVCRYNNPNVVEYVHILYRSCLLDGCKFLMYPFVFLYILCIMLFTDDLSEDRLKALWLEAHPPAVDHPDTPDVSQDRTQESPQVTDSLTAEEREGGREGGEGREVDGEGGEGGAGGSGENGQVSGAAGENERQDGEEEGGGEEEKEKGEGAGGEGKGGEEEEGGGDNGGKEEEKEGNREEGDAEKEKGGGEEEGEKVQENGDVGERQTAEQMAGFGEEPFVQAAAKFLRYDLTGILELLTQAIKSGQ